MATVFDIHIHTNLDPVEGKKAYNFITYTPEKLFKKARKKGFNVLSLTHHKELIYSDELANKAQKYGILLIPGVEAVVEGMDVIILNPLKKTYNSFKDIKEEKKRNKHCFIFAPHPFFPRHYCLKNYLFQYIDLFDGIEFSHFSFLGVKRYNSQARLVAEKFNKQFIGTGDVHNLRFLGKTYSSFKKNVHTIEEFISALKTEKITIHTKDLHYFEVIETILFHLFGKFKKRIHKFKRKIISIFKK